MVLHKTIEMKIVVARMMTRMNFQTRSGKEQRQIFLRKGRTE